MVTEILEQMSELSNFIPDKLYYGNSIETL